MSSNSKKKYFIPLESDPELFTELIHGLGMSKRLAFHDLLTLSPSDGQLLASVPRPVVALILVVPAPDGYGKRLREEEEERGVGFYDAKGEEEGVLFYHQTIGNACGLYAVLHAVCNGRARAFVEPNTHIAHIIEKCASLDSAGRIAMLEADEQLAAAHASVASRGSTTPNQDITVEAPFAYMTFVPSSRESKRLYQLEGCRLGPVDLGYVLDEGGDLLGERALDAVGAFVKDAGRGVDIGYSALALCVQEEG